VFHNTATFVDTFVAGGGEVAQTMYIHVSKCKNNKKKKNNNTATFVLVVFSTHDREHVAFGLLSLDSVTRDGDLQFYPFTFK
jgi:hypothetical protein